MKNCVFCNGNLKGNGSNEHILPQWLLEEFCIRDTEISPTHFSTEGNVISTRHHQLKNLVAGRICRTCNSGWMSELESEAQEYIVALSLNRISVVDLSDKERFTLARWAFKTALTLNLATNYRKNIPLSHYKYLYEQKFSLPDCITVLAQNHHYNQDFYWIQSATWKIDDQTDTLNQNIINFLTENSYKIGFQFRGLLLVIAFNPLEDYVFSMWQGIHLPLYPKRGSVGWYSDEEFPWNDSQEALFSFHMGLGLVQFANSKQVKMSE